MRDLNLLCPESIRDDANHLAACVGTEMRNQDGSLGDIHTFSTATHEDADGNRYIAVGVRISEAKAEALQYLIAHPELLTRPAFDTGNEIDMGAAASALATVGSGLLIGFDASVIPEGFQRVSD